MKYLVEPQNIMIEKEVMTSNTCMCVVTAPCSTVCSTYCSSKCNNYCPGRCYRSVPYNELEEK